MTMLIAILVVLICILAGRTIMHLSSSTADGVNGLLLSLLSGLLFFIGLKSIISTGGRTVFVLLVPVMIMYFFATGRKALPVKLPLMKSITGDLKLFFYSLPVLVILCLLAAGLKPGADEFYYISLAESNARHGIESTFSNYASYTDIWNGYVANSRYHYFDLWFASLLFDVFPVSNATLFMQTAFPVFGYIFFLCIAAIGAQFWKKPVGWLFAVSFVFSFIVMLYPLGHVPHYFNREIGGNKFLAYTPLSSIKYVLGPLLVVLSILAISKRSLTDLWLYATIIAICHFLFFPVVISACIGLGLVILFAQYKWKLAGFAKKDVLRFLLFNIVTAILLLGVYKIFGTAESASPLVSSKVSVKQLLQNPYRTSILTSVVEVVFQFAAILPALLIVLIAVPLKKEWFKNNYTVITWVLALIAWGTIPRSILNPVLEESWQLEFYFYFIPVLLITILGYFAAISSLSKRKFAAIAIIAIHVIASIGLSIPGFSRNYKNAVAYNEAVDRINGMTAKAGKSFEGNGVFLSDTTGLQCTEYLKNIYLNDFSGFIKYQAKSSNIVSLDPIDSAFVKRYSECNLKPSTKEQVLGLTITSPFIKYNLSNNGKGTEQNQIDFINKYNIRYLVAEKGAAIPPSVLKIATAVITDSNSGIKVVFFK